MQRPPLTLASAQESRPGKDALTALRESAASRASQVNQEMADAQKVRIAKEDPNAAADRKKKIQGIIDHKSSSASAPTPTPAG